MKKYSMLGNHKGKVAYRTPSVFRQKVSRVVRNISPGRTLSYKSVAEKAGSPRAYRAVGNILSQNYDPKIPCHRVIRSNGSLGGYNRGNRNKKNILKKEKAFRDGKI